MTAASDAASIDTPIVGPRINGAHDVGGARDLGPIPQHLDGATFHEPWEGIVMAMCLGGVAGGMFAVDQHRARLGGMHPVAYMSTSYYEQWLSVLETLMVDSGTVTLSEIEERVVAVAENPDMPLPAAASEELLERIRGLITRGIPQLTLDTEPRFKVGDRIRAKVIPVELGKGHTRVPAYVQGHEGVVEIVQLPQALAEAVVAGEGWIPEHVYAVRFRNSDLWPGANANDTVIVDLWESYMEPAGAPAPSQEEES